MSDDKKLILLDTHNQLRLGLHVQLNSNEPRPNGIACPKCGKELFDTCPNLTLSSNPPQKNIGCECGYAGYRYC